MGLILAVVLSVGRVESQALPAWKPPALKPPDFSRFVEIRETVLESPWKVCPICKGLRGNGLHWCRLHDKGWLPGEHRCPKCPLPGGPDDVVIPAGE